MIVLSEFTVNVAAEPWNFTVVVVDRFVPLIVTDVPTGPLDGLKLEIAGGVLAPVTRKFVELTSLPAGVVTMIRPVVAPTGTLVVICVSRFVANTAAVPLNSTEVAPVNPEPVSVTLVPGGPLVGLNETILT